MMHINKLFTVFAAAALILAGCKQTEEEKAPELNFSGDGASLLGSGISADAAGGDWQISFTSATAWSISVSETKALSSWLVVTPPAGKGGPVDAVITVLPNTDTKERSAQLSFVSGSVSKTMTITQGGRGTISLSSVVLNESAVEFYPGETFQLVATVLPSNADGSHAVKWESSNNGVVKVEGGLLTAVGEGSATVTASAGSVKATCAVTVLHRAVPVTGISLDITNLTLETGSAAKLTATVEPAGADDSTPAWTSSDPAVATVDANGTVTAKAVGTAVITVTAGGKSASCTVTVISSYVPVESITISQSTLELKVGEDATLTATVNPSNASDAALTWESSAPTVVSVTDGLVKALSVGSATITVKAGGKSATCTVTVSHKGNGGENMDDPINVNPW